MILAVSNETFCLVCLSDFKVNMVRRSYSSLCKSKIEMDYGTNKGLSSLSYSS